MIEGNGEGYYHGKQYIVAGEKYAIFTRYIDLAKKYKSRKVAENVLNKLLESCTNVAKNSFNGCFINISIKEVLEK